MTKKTKNQSLGKAQAAKQDEFYTRYDDVQKEVEAYLEFDPDTFRGKVVYCNCDDPFESNFFKYFAATSTSSASTNSSPPATTVHQSPARAPCSRNTTRVTANDRSPRRWPSSSTV